MVAPAIGTLNALATSLGIEAYDRPRAFMRRKGATEEA